MVLSHLVLLLLIGAAVAHDSCLAPGSTVTSTETSTTTTTVSVGDDDDGFISVADRQAIRSTWAQARKNFGVIAPQILLRLLQRNPALQQKFPRFANVTQDQLASNLDVQVQAYTIMAGLNKIIESFCSRRNWDREVGLLGKGHNYHSSATDFKLMGEVILEVLSDRVGLSAQAKNAWQNGLRALTNGVGAYLKYPDFISESRVGLTVNQIYWFRNIGWNSVSGERSKIAGAILKSVFKQNPGLQQKFPRFANVPLDALDSDAEFQKQASVIGDRINAIVVELDGSGERLEGELISLVVSHKARGVDSQFLNMLIDAVMEQVSGGGAPAKVQATYRQVLQMLGNKIRKIEKAMH